MDFLPKDPAILVSSVNMLLRDEEFDSLESLCYAFNRDPEEVKHYLEAHGYVWSAEQMQFRPEGFDQQIPRSAIETAYAFFHQKQRVYQYSTLDWQKDDIEWAIGDYVDNMSPQLYALISGGKQDFLRRHTNFGEELMAAVEQLEGMLA